jgi:CubicO group peptidase (beta-lactamase class C family)
LVSFSFPAILQKKSNPQVKAGLSTDTLELASKKMQEYIDNSKLAGISTLINVDGETIVRENFGYSNIENQKPIEDNTIYRIFSMTKPITAVALMTLFDEGKFALDDKVSQYIPEFEGAQVYNAETKTLEPQVNELTIRHLLTHTSGIPYGWDQKAYVDSLYRVEGAGGWEGTIGEKVKIMAKIPLKNQPGTKWEYGLGIDVAGYLVEVLSGTPLDEYMKAKIFDPLKMEDTGFYVPEDKHDRFCGLYAPKDGGLVFAERMKDAFKTPVTLFSGGGGLTSSMDDYLTFCKMLLNGGELNGVRIIEESTAQLIMTNQLPEGVKYEGYKGYGLAGSVDLETGEYGWAGAASTKFWISPANKMITFAFAQLMPANYTYADEFKAIVDRAVVK